MAFDAIEPAKLGQKAIEVTPTVTTVHTVAALTRTIVKDIDICNTTTADINVTVYLVPSGDSPGTDNELLSNLPVRASTAIGGVLQWSGSQILNEGDTIQATATATGLTINVSGGIAT